MANNIFDIKDSKNFTLNTKYDTLTIGIVKEMTSETFNNLRKTIYDLTGIYYTDTKKYLLESRVQKRLEENNLKTFEEYHTLILSTRGREELNKLFDAITINETFFFRAEQQFDAFEKVLVPELIANLPPHNRKIRIWSAASSSGEEAYTVAMIIDHKLKQLYPNITFEIVATDINQTVIEQAKAGIYKEYAIRNVLPEYMNKYFTKNGDKFILSPRIKSMVTFRNLNLYDPVAIRSLSTLDIVFCCNVLIYFDIPSKQKVVSYIYDSIRNGGYLFVGYSESLHGVTQSFKLVHLHKAMAYKKDI